MYNIYMIEKRLRKLDYLYSPSNQEVYTPLKLVDEILDKLPLKIWEDKSLKWFNPAVKSGVWLGAIVVKLAKSYVDKSIFNTKEEALFHILNNQIYGYTLSKGALRTANKILYGSNKYKGNVEFKNVLEENIDMKFDVVIGNPPYQPPRKNDSFQGQGSRYDIWSDFIEIGFKLLNDNGCIGFVTPHGWRSGILANKKNIIKIQNIIWNNSILFAKDVKKYFNNVGKSITIGAWIVKKDGLKKHLLDIDQSFINNKLIPKGNNKHCQTFFTALDEEKEFFNLSITCTVRKNDELSSLAEGNDVYRYKHFNTSAQFKKGLFEWHRKKSKGFSEKKVIVSDSGSPGPFYDSKGEIGCGSHSFAYSVKNDADAKLLVKFFNSSIAKEIVEEFIEQDSFGFPIRMFRKIPKQWLNKNFN